MDPETSECKVRSLGDSQIHFYDDGAVDNKDKIF